MPPRSDATLRSLARKTIRALTPRKEVPTTGRAISVDAQAQTAVVRVAGSTSQSVMQIVSQELTNSLRLRVKAREMPTVQIDRGVIIGFVAGTPAGRRKAGRNTLQALPLGAEGDDEIVTPTEDALPSPFWASMEEQATGPSITGGPRRLDISWIPVTSGGVIGYRIRVVDGLGIERFYQAEGNSSGISITGLTEGTTIVQVQAIGADGVEGAWSYPIQVEVLAPTMPLGAPILSSTFRQVLIVIPTAIPGTDEVTLMSGWQVEVRSDRDVVADIIDLTHETLRTVVTGEPGETLTVRYRYVNDRGAITDWSKSASITVESLSIGFEDLAGLEQVSVTSSNPARTSVELGAVVDGQLSTTAFTAAGFEGSFFERLTFSWPLAVRIAGVILYSPAPASPAWRLEYQDVAGAWRTLGSNSDSDHTVIGSPESRVLREYIGENVTSAYVQEALGSNAGLYFKEWRFGDSAAAGIRKFKAITAQRVRLFLPTGFAASEVRILTYEAAHLLMARRLYLSEGAQIASSTSSSSFEITPEAITGYDVGGEVGRISAGDGSLWWKKGGFGGTATAPVLKLNDNGTIQLGTGGSPLLLTNFGLERQDGFLSVRSDTGITMRRGVTSGEISWLNPAMEEVGSVYSSRANSRNTLHLVSNNELSGEGAEMQLTTTHGSLGETSLRISGGDRQFVFTAGSLVIAHLTYSGLGGEFYIGGKVGIGLQPDPLWAIRADGQVQIRGGLVMADGASTVSGGGNRLDMDANTMRLRNARTPNTSGSSGSPGEFCWNDAYLFVRNSTGWRRIALGDAY